MRRWMDQLSGARWGDVAAVWLVVRTGLRARWRSWLVLAVLAGLAGGMVIAVAAGARRTDAAYPSLIAWSAAPDALVAPGRERVPQVSEAAAVTAYGVLSPAVLDVYAPADSRVPDSFWHRKLLAGRPADPRRADEAEVEFTAAQALHLAPGSRLCVELIGASGGAVPFCFRVVAVDATPGDFPPEYGTGTDTVWATPAFARTVGGRLAGSQIAVVRLRRGAADLPAVERQAAGPSGGSTLTAYPYGPQEANTERSIHLQAIVLWLLAGVLAVVGLLVFGQLLARLTALESADFGVQRTLGMTSGQLTAVGLARAAIIGAVGAVLAAGIAAAASPLFPVGLAADAEPHPGFRADWVALGLGMAGVAVGVVACGAWPAARAANWRRNRAALAVRRPPRGASLGRLPLPVAGEAGIWLVLHRGAGRTALPVLSAVTAAAVGVAGLSAAVVFGGEPRKPAGLTRALRGDVGRAGRLPAVRRLARPGGAHHRRRSGGSPLDGGAFLRAGRGRRRPGRRHHERAGTRRVARRRPGRRHPAAARRRNRPGPADARRDRPSDRPDGHGVARRHPAARHHADRRDRDLPADGRHARARHRRRTHGRRPARAPAVGCFGADARRHPGQVPLGGRHIAGYGRSRGPAGPGRAVRGHRTGYAGGPGQLRATAGLAPGARPDARRARRADPRASAAHFGPPPAARPDGAAGPRLHRRRGPRRRVLDVGHGDRARLGGRNPGRTDLRPRRLAVPHRPARRRSAGRRARPVIRPAGGGGAGAGRRGDRRPRSARQPHPPRRHPAGGVTRSRRSRRRGRHRRSGC